MHIRSDSFDHHAPIPARFAAGERDGEGVGFGRNLNPHLTWRDAPPETRSFVLLCIDADAPTVPEMAGKEGVEIPFDQPRTDFCHWAMIDIPPHVDGVAEGSCSDGVTPHGKRDPKGPEGSRQGLNDYTGWFAEDPALTGEWLGYDGPFPPPNDRRPHRYFFRLYALDVSRLDVADRFTCADVQRAMQHHVLAEALLQGVYTLHPEVEARTAS